MLMIRSIIRPERVDAVLAALMEAGFPAITKINVVGRGKQRGMKIGEVTYEDLRLDAAQVAEMFAGRSRAQPRTRTW